MDRVEAAYKPLYQLKHHFDVTLDEWWMIRQVFEGTITEHRLKRPQSQDLLKMIRMRIRDSFMEKEVSREETRDIFDDFDEFWSF